MVDVTARTAEVQNVTAPKTAGENQVSTLISTLFAAGRCRLGTRQYDLLVVSDVFREGGKVSCCTTVPSQNGERAVICC